MGMFNYLKCERIMPDGYDGTGKIFQTKDFECDMSTYVINQEGKLIGENYHYEDVPKEERPYPDGEGWKEWCGSLKKVIDSHYDRNYHGFLRFYDIEEKKCDCINGYIFDTSGSGKCDIVCPKCVGGTIKKWHDYTAKFTDGTLVEITMAEIDE